MRDIRPQHWQDCLQQIGVLEKLCGDAVDPKAQRAQEFSVFQLVDRDTALTKMRRPSRCNKQMKRAIACSPKGARQLEGDQRGHAVSEQRERHERHAQQRMKVGDQRFHKVFDSYERRLAQAA
jgi:hypothetical protein